MKKNYEFSISEKYSLFRFFIKCAFRVFWKPKYSAQIFADHFQCEFKRAIMSATGDILSGQTQAVTNKPKAASEVVKDTKIKISEV